MRVTQLVYCEYQVLFDDGSINTRTSSVCIVVIRINNLLESSTVKPVRI